MTTKPVWCVVAVCALTFVTMGSADLHLDLSRVASRASAACQIGIRSLQPAILVAGTTRRRMCSITKNSLFRQTLSRSLSCSSRTISDLQTTVCGINDRTPAAQTPAFVTAANREANTLTSRCRLVFKHLIGTVFLIYSRSESCLAMQSSVLENTLTGIGGCFSFQYNRVKRVVCQSNEGTTRRPTLFPSIPTTPRPVPTAVVTSALPPLSNDLQFRISLFTDTCGTAKNAAASWVRGKSARYLCQWMGINSNEMLMRTMGCSILSFRELKNFVCNQINRSPAPITTPRVTDGPRVVDRTDLDRRLQEVSRTLSTSCRALVSSTRFRFQSHTKDEACDAFGSSSFRQFLTSSGRFCTNNEYEKLKDAVCGASMHALALSLTLLCMLAHFFSQRFKL